MTDSMNSQTDPFPIESGAMPSPAAADSFVQLGSLLADLEAGSVPDRGASRAASADRLARARLGVASSLHVALRCKSVHAASHGLRVSLIASGWSAAMGLPDSQREAIEIAALLHDVGMIGLPDEILRKPGALEHEEMRLVDEARKMSTEILRSACAEPVVLSIVEHIPAWYDGSRPGYSVCGQAIPLGARLVTIVEAFDAMTTEQVYRPAMSLERAGIELFRFAGTQFDPSLVNAFVEFQASNLDQVQEEVSGRWLRSLAPETSNSYWGLTDCFSHTKVRHDLRFFEDRLLDNMHDAVVFIDASLRILRWNHGAERLTGIAGTSICDRRWAPSLLSLRSEKGAAVSEADCPVNNAVLSGVQSLRRLSISCRNRDRVAVDSHTIPVIDPDGAILGAALILHDASSETSLEERCQSLHNKATRDSLTQVANRAEFDRVFDLFISTHRQQQVPCSLIICDLDLFKSINDTYGHQAGDEAIRSLARLLKSSCRPGDLVARYGGEEFVLLCADCDNGSAARRADEIRKRLAQTPQPSLRGRSITASFGVTQVQPGDTAETMLRRADRGLLIAKERGRNAVVQLGSGSGHCDSGDAPVVRGQAEGIADCQFSTVLCTPMPIAVIREKLNGFVADHQAKVVEQTDSSASLVLTNGRRLKRRSDRNLPFLMGLRFERDEQAAGEGTARNKVPQTRIRVILHPRRDRDRRREGIEGAARELIASLRSYLGASEEERDSGDPVAEERAAWWQNGG